MKHKIEVAVNTLFILFLPIMMYVNVGEAKVNISIADSLLVLVALLFLINIKEFFMERRWWYLLYFVGLVFSLYLSQRMSMQNEAFHHVENSVMLMEMVKALVVAAYFFSAFIFIQNKKDYQIVLNAISFSSIPVLLIGFSSYFYFLAEKEFPIENFQITGNLRFLGTFEDPNLAALFFIFVFFISLSNFQFAKHWALRGMMLVICSFSLVAIFLTMSRGGWLALTVALIVFLILNVKFFNRNSLILVFSFVIFAFLLINIDLTYQDGKITNTVVNRIQASLSSDMEDVDRVQLSKTAIEMGNDNFLWGVGKGSFPLNTYKYLGEDSPMYKNQYIPHNTLASFYAQQGIIGLLIFIILPGYIFYRMIRLKNRQNYYLIPLFIGIVVHSLTINIENVRFIWYFLGLLLAGEMRGISIEAVSPVKVARKTFAIVLCLLLVVTIVLSLDLSRKMAMNIYVAKGNVYEKQVEVPEPGEYVVSFDVQTDGNRHLVRIFDGETLLEEREFQSALGLVQLPIHIENEAKIMFQGAEEGWMRVNNAYIKKENEKIPLYNYVLLPTGLEQWFNERTWLHYVEEPSFQNELLVGDNVISSLQIVDARIVRYGNLTHILEFDMNRNGAIDKDYQLELLLHYDSISDQLAGEPQRNQLPHRFGLNPPTSSWEDGKSYTVRTNRLLSNEKFKLYGRYYEPQAQVYTQDSYFPIEYKAEHEKQEILPLGKSQWINVRYGKDKEGRINISYNGWVESGRMNLEPGSYEITFEAQGSFYEEYSKIRLRDSALETIAELPLDDSLKEYTIRYDADEYQEGVSFILELINYKSEKDVGNRRVFLEDWVSVEKVTE